MKKTFSIFLGALFLSSALVAPVSALTFEEVQGQIKELLSRVAALSVQLNQLKAVQNTSQQIPVTSVSVASSGYPHRVCGVVSRNLSQGMSGDDVHALQDFLYEEGYMTDTKATSYFGPRTAAAVAKWQAKEGLSTVGAFGPLSRERLKGWCGGGGWTNSERFVVTPTRGDAPLTVVFETWLSGFRPSNTYYTIDFGDGANERAADCYAPADACLSPGQNKHTYTQNGTYTASLNKVFDPCAGNIACKAPIQYTPVAKAQISVGTITCTTEYAPVCGQKYVTCIKAPCDPILQTYSNRCAMEADGAQLLYEGMCHTETSDPSLDPRCKSWYDGCNTCSRETPQSPAMCTLRACIPEVMSRSYCTAHFDSTTNKAPTISGFSGPTVLSINQTGTWSVTASDPENGQLSYSIRWGDEANVYPSAAAEYDRSVTQATTFTHTYAKSGTYTVAITVSDALGQSSRASATVVVKDSVVCSQEYAPVCGRLPGCMNTCPAGMYCTMMCQMHPAVTYSNRCYLNAAGAEFLHVGVCAGNDY